MRNTPMQHPVSHTQPMTRRQILKASGAIAALTATGAVGYQLLGARGSDAPVSVSPYRAAYPTTNQVGDDTGVAPPILVLVPENNVNPFGHYLGAILQAEGISSFDIAPWKGIDSQLLQQYPLLIVTEGVVGQDAVDLLTSYVVQGGRLMAMRPQRELADLCGVSLTAGITMEGYWRVEQKHPLLSGFVGEAMQFHGAASHYRLDGADALAWITDTRGAGADYPALCLNRVGAGQAVLWAYDLAKSVVYTRQGNPAWSNQDRDAREGIRAHDAFVGWIDLDHIHLAQADEQMRLFSRLVTALLADVLPLPRFWYFPDQFQTMLIATGDSHGNPSAVVDETLRQVEQRGGHMSVYYSPQATSSWRQYLRRARWWAGDLPWVGDYLDNPNGMPSPSQVADWRRRGHEFTFHPTVTNPPYVDGGVERGYRDGAQEFNSFGYAPLGSTVRTHRVLWNGWVESARALASHGIRMNMDFYHVGPSFQKADGEWVYGHFTGSGLPMKFIDENGRILNIYQQLTQLVDEHLFTVPWGTHVDLTPAAAVEVSKEVMRRSLSGGYAALGAQFHLDPFAVGSQFAVDAQVWLAGTLDFAQSNNVPIWSAEAWLDFTERRDDSTIDELRWQAADRRLHLRVDSAVSGDANLSLLLPVFAGLEVVEVNVDGVITEHVAQNLGGMRFRVIQVSSGSHQIDVNYA